MWAVDFQFDATTDGRPIKLVSIIDEHTRECLSSLVERSVTADVLIDELDRLALLRGYPAVLRCDNGPELACEAMADWAGERVGLSFIPPGEPGATATSSRSTAASATNASTSTSSGPFAQAGVVISDWKDYNHRRRSPGSGRLLRDVA